MFSGFVVVSFVLFCFCMKFIVSVYVHVSRFPSVSLSLSLSLFVSLSFSLSLAPMKCTYHSFLLSSFVLFCLFLVWHVCFGLLPQRGGRDLVEDEG